MRGITKNDAQNQVFAWLFHDPSLSYKEQLTKIREHKMKNQDPIIVVVKELQKLVLIVKEMELRLQKMEGK